MGNAYVTAFGTASSSGKCQIKKYIFLHTYTYIPLALPLFSIHVHRMTAASYETGCNFVKKSE